MQGIRLGPGARLLISVRSAGEIYPAIDGGAEILDVKDPGRGSLGAADPHVVRAARWAAPAATPVTAALGDCLPVRRGELDRLARLAEALAGAGASLLKIGLSGLAPETAVASLHYLTARLAGPGGAPVHVVAVAFADERRPAAIRPADLAGVAASAGIDGVMLDTLDKSRSLLDHIDPRRLREWAGSARARGLVCGVAGSLGLDQVAAVAASGVDVVGLRGAVCADGRRGRLDPDLVRRARAATDGARCATLPASAVPRPPADARPEGRCPWSRHPWT